MEHFSCADCEVLGLASGLGTRIGNLSAILQISNPMNCGPIPELALGGIVSIALRDIDPDPGEVEIGISISVIGAVGTVDVWL